MYMTLRARFLYKEAVVAQWDSTCPIKIKKEIIFFSTNTDGYFFPINLANA